MCVGTNSFPRNKTLEEKVLKALKRQKRGKESKEKGLIVSLKPNS